MLVDRQKQTCSGRRGLWIGKNKLVRGVEACGSAKTNLFGASRLVDRQKQICSGRRGLWIGKNKLVRGVEALGSPRIFFSEVPRAFGGPKRVSIFETESHFLRLESQEMILLHRLFLRYSLKRRKPRFGLSR